MTEAQIKAELKKCKESPYYFMTKYWQVDGKPFTTMLSEEEFNRTFKLIETGMFMIKSRRKYGDT